MSKWSTALYKYRRIQYLTSSFSVFLTQKRWVFITQILFFMCGLISATVGRFYFWERYHLYGCRQNYETGFPQACPSHRRYKGIDLSTGTCYAVSAIFLWVMILLPVMWMKFHWKCWLANEIALISRKVLAENQIYDTRIIEPVESFLILAEGLNVPCCITVHGKKPAIKHVHRHRFLTHLGSCVWGELYLLYLFGQKLLFIIMIILIFLTLSIPLFSPLLSSGWTTFAMMMSMLCFMFSPCFSGLLFVILMACVLSHSLIHVCIFLVSWCVLCVGVLIFSYAKGMHDELDLLRRVYGEQLQASTRNISPGDLDTLLYLRGFGKGTLLSDVKKCITDLARRIAMSR